MPSPPPRSPERPTGPTYLNYRDASIPSFPQPPISPSRTAPPIPIPASAIKTQFSATLLILVSDAASPSLQNYLGEILTRYAVTEAALLATSESALKAARMDVYTAAGKMRQDIAVSTSLVGSDGAGGLEEAVKRGVSGKTLCGVLVCQHSAIQWPDVRREVLDYEAGEMEDSWRTNILTLHTLARITVPLLRRASSHSAPFFYLDSLLPLSPLDSITQSALLDSISRTSLTQGLKVGYAKEELVPEPVEEEPKGIDIPLRNSNGNGNGHRNSNSNNGNGNDFHGNNGSAAFAPVEDESPLPESPTKLWASWAMMNE